MLGELTSAWTHLQRGFELYDPQKHRHHAFLYGGHDPGVCCGYHAGDVLWLLGYPDHALRRSQESLALARELSHPSTMSVALFFTAWFHQQRGEAEAVQARIEEGMTIASRAGLFALAWRREPFCKDGSWLKGAEQAGIGQMAQGSRR